MGLFNKNKGLKSVDTNETIDRVKNVVYGTVLYRNNMIDICADAYSSCYNVTLENTSEAKLKYVGKIVGHKHTSGLEHSNLVTYYQVHVDSEPRLQEVMDVINHCKYLTCRVTTLDTLLKYPEATRRLIDNNKYNMCIIIGGSIRGYQFLLDNVSIPASNNILLNEIKKTLYSTYSELFEKYISDGVMNLENFPTHIEELTSIDRIRAKSFKPIDIDNDISIVNIDSLEEVKDNIRKITEKNFITYNDYSLYDLCTVTVKFKNMSRVITQQLTRHRNGITQESQRYVNYKNALFNSPSKFNPDKYNENDKYTINFGGHVFNMSLEELGQQMANIYGDLINSKTAQPLRKEDARGYLPQNIQCGSVYMTFNLRTLFSFFELRSDAAAQAEIRSYAVRLIEWWNDSGDIQQKYCPKYDEYSLMPYYKRVELANYDEVDEVVETVDEVVDIQ